MKRHYCFLENFNNYFNRKIILYKNLSDYISNSENYFIPVDSNGAPLLFDFNPNNDVSTEVIVNDMPFTPNYFLLLDEELNIIQRWFVVDNDRNRQGQWTYKLKRDVVAESIIIDKFKAEAPIYVEKGHLLDTDPMIVNSEGMQFNQIKKEEILLNDPTECGYVVGYFASGTSITNKEIATNNQAILNYLTLPQIASDTGIDGTKIQNMLEGISIPFATGRLTISFGMDSPQDVPPFGRRGELYIKSNLDMDSVYQCVLTPFLSWTERIGSINVGIGSPVLAPSINYFNSLTKSQRETMLNDVIDNDIPGEKIYTDDNLTKLGELVGKVIYYSGKYYIVDSIDTSETTKHSEVVITKGENASFDAMIASSLKDGVIYNNGKMYLNYSIKNVSIKISPYDAAAIKYSVSASANSLQDAPYSMFVIPFGKKFSFTLPGNIPYLYDIDRIITKEEALMVASDIAKDMDAACYDIQILPYCPNYDKWVEKFTSGDDQYLVFAVRNKTVDVDFNLIQLKSDGTPIGLIIYPQLSNFSQTIVRELSLKDGVKIESQCNFYRLCSPNYNGVFEFNLAKMGGKVSNFYVDCTYKPYNPFIKVSPEFSFLYGTNFNDGRGLICGGEFSLPIMKSAWESYELNNKNFTNVFSREIQNLDFTQKQERIQEAIKLGAGAVGGAAGGALAGGKLGGGNPYAVAGGALAGGGIGIVGGIIDYTMSEARRAETKDYALDRFNMNLDNIKAIPLSLNRVSTFNIINRIYPFIEYYTCTDEEKEALRKKIEYDGMTVGRIGFVSEYQYEGTLKYFKGQLIRAEGINQSSHFINVLYEEILKGVYL